MLISHLFRLWITLLWVAQAQSLAFLLSQRCPLSIFEHKSQITTNVVKCYRPHIDPLLLAKHPISVLGIVSVAGFYIVAPTQLFKRRRRFFKARLCPCALKHANMTFVCCFPSDNFFCQQLKKIKKRRKENSAEKRARPIVPGRGDQERKAFALMRPFLQWRHCLSCSASLSKLVFYTTFSCV